MSKQDNLSDLARPLDEAELETQALLARLRPVKASIDVAGVLAEAANRAKRQRRAAVRQIWVWRGITAAMAASLVVIAWLHLSTTRETQIVVKIVHDRTGEPAVAVAPINEIEPAATSCSYLILRQQVLTQGMAGLPDPPEAGNETSPMTVKGINLNGL